LILRVAVTIHAERGIGAAAECQRIVRAIGLDVTGKTVAIAQFQPICAAGELDRSGECASTSISSTTLDRAGIDNRAICGYYAVATVTTQAATVAARDNTAIFQDETGPPGTCTTSASVTMPTIASAVTAVTASHNPAAAIRNSNPGI